jgi:hypothetical protein
MERFDRGRDAIDRHAELVQVLGKPGQHLAGIVVAGALPDQPILEAADAGEEGGWKILDVPRRLGGRGSSGRGIVHAAKVGTAPDDRKEDTASTSSCGVHPMANRVRPMRPIGRLHSGSLTTPQRER